MHSDLCVSQYQQMCKNYDFKILYRKNSKTHFMYANFICKQPYICTFCNIASISILYPCLIGQISIFIGILKTPSNIEIIPQILFRSSVLSQIEEWNFISRALSISKFDLKYVCNTWETKSVPKLSKNEKSNVGEYSFPLRL